MPLSVNVVRLQDRSSVTLEVRGAKTDVVAAVDIGDAAKIAYYFVGKIPAL